MKPHHFTVLDSWRGVCALIVCVFHFPAVGAVTSLDFFRHGEMFVDFFFVLSGFVIAANYMDRVGSTGEIGRFMWLRIGRLYPLHLFVLLVYVAYELARYVGSATHGAFAGDKSIDAIWTNLLLVQAFGFHGDVTWNRPAWSISVEMYTCLVFALATAVFGRARYFAYAGLIAASLIVLLTVNGGVFLSTHDFAIFRCVAGFFAGVLVWRLWKGAMARTDRIARLAPVATAIELATLAGVIVFVTLTGNTLAAFWSPAIFGAAVFVFSFEFGALSRLLKWRPAVFLGTLSYSIYMIHAFMIERILTLARKVDERAGTGFLQDLPNGNAVLQASPAAIDLLTALFLAAVVIAASLTYRWIELPARDWFRRTRVFASRTPAS